MTESATGGRPSGHLLRPRREDRSTYDATFEVLGGGSGISIVFHSRGGARGTATARNTEYGPGLEALLQKLRDLGAVLADATVDSDSAAVRRLAPHERRIPLGDLRLPVTLTEIPDISILARKLQTGQQRVGSTATRGGNPTKRIRLLINVPGFGSSDAAALGDALVGAPSGVREVVRPHRNGERRYWSLFANPRIYRIDEALEASERDRWLVRDRDVRAGDRALVWRGASLDGLRGVVTFAEVLTDPEDALLATPFWAGQDPPAGPSVAVRYMQPDGLPVLFPSRDSVTEPWSRLGISRATGGGIFPVQPDDWAAVVRAAGGWPAEGTRSTAGPPRPSTRASRVTPAEKKAIERRAVHVAITHLAKTWETVDDVGDVESYDLRCSTGVPQLRRALAGLRGPF